VHYTRYFLQCGDIIQAVIRGAVDWLLIFNPNAYGVLVQCTSTGTRVTVEAPVGTQRADVDVNVQNGM